MAVFAPERTRLTESIDLQRSSVRMPGSLTPVDQGTSESQAVDLFEDVPLSLLPAPFLTGTELEVALTLSRYEIRQIVRAHGWTSCTALLRFGRGRGSPTLFPLLMLPALELVKTGRVESARALMKSADGCLGQPWSSLLSLLRATASFYPAVILGISRADGVAIARGLGGSPDLLDLARASAHEQFERLSAFDPDQVAVGQWLKVDRERAPHGAPVWPLPPVLQEDRTGPYGPLLMVMKSGSWGLHPRVAMPEEALPMQVGTTAVDRADDPTLPNRRAGPAEFVRDQPAI